MSRLLNESLRVALRLFIYLNKINKTYNNEIFYFSKLTYVERSAVKTRKNRDRVPEKKTVEFPNAIVRY